MTWEIKTGDCLTVLRTMPDESVHMVCTSPPYWGLRDYKTAGQLGLERTPEEYVSKMVEVFREVKRALRADGTCWLNMGDSYAAGKQGRGDSDRRNGHGAFFDGTDRPRQACGEVAAREVPDGLKPKDLCGIPWRLAFALQADGWYLRSDIIWHKPNPMPESVTDRPTKSHEYIFLLSKSERYFYDQEAVREPLAESTLADGRNGSGRHTQGEVEGSKYSAENRPDLPSWYRGKTFVNPLQGRNRRTVWSITTYGFPSAHFATFPPELPEVCIKAGTSEKGCCKECGAPWERVIEKPELGEAELPSDCGTKYADNGRQDAARRMAAKREHLRNVTGNHDDYFPGAKTLGWQPTCTHSAEVIPGTVLDPFSGAGTTGLVATRLGRSYIGIELNADYVAMSEERITNDAPLFNTFPAELAEGGPGPAQLEIGQDTAETQSGREGK